MADPGRTALEDQLGRALPPGAEALSDAELADLAEALATVHERQAAALDVAIDQALEGVPRLLRGTARKILLG